MLIVLKKICCLIVFLLVFSACTTIYKPSHRFMDQTYQPVKEGVIELEVRRYFVSSDSDNGIKSPEQAYRVGRNDAKRSMRKFCKGEFSIKNISKEKEQTGVENITSTTQRSNTSGLFDIVNSGGYKTTYGKRDGYNRGRRGRGRRGRGRRHYTYKSPEISHGHSQAITQGHTQGVSRTRPTYREYELITFQCQKK